MNDEEQIKPDRRDFHDIVVAVLFLVGFALGLLGFLQAAPDGPALQRWANALHSTIQLIVLNVDADSSPGWLLGFARVLLPAAASYLIFRLLVDRFGQWARRLRWHLPSRLRPRAPLLLVLGCGRTGTMLARFYAMKGMTVLGIDRDIRATGVRPFAAAGYPMLSLDFADERDFWQLPLRAASRVIVCSGDDRVDLQTCRRLLAVSEARRLPLRITMTMDSPETARLVQLDAELSRQEATPSFNLIDLDHHSARALFLEAAPGQLQPGRFVPGADNPCHIALLAGPAHRVTYLAQAARALVYSVSSPLRITLFTEGAADCEALLRRSFPALWPGDVADDENALFGGFAPLAQVQVIESGASQMNLRAFRNAHRAQRLDAVYVVGDDDAQTALLLAEAIKAADGLADPPAIVAAASHGAIHLGSAAAQARQAAGPAQARFVVDPAALGRSDLQVRRFDTDGWLVGEASGADTPDGGNDGVARSLASRYQAALAKDGQPAPSRDWHCLPEHERWWNRHAADHALLKLHMVRASLGAAGAGTDAEDAAFQQHRAWFTALEHRRYTRERMIEGWVRRTPLGPAGVGSADRPKVNGFRLNPTLKPYAELDAYERVKDDTFADLVHVRAALQEQQTCSSGNR